MSLRLYAATLLALSATACTNYSSSTVTPTPPPGASQVSIPVGAAALGRLGYAPNEIDVTAGTTVTWENNDSQAHTSTSDVAGWDSGVVAPGAQFSVTFPSAGTFQYHCSLHPGMVGRVVVR